MRPLLEPTGPRPDTPAPAPAAAPDAYRLRVLAVDDHEPTRVLLRYLLAPTCTLASAAGYEAALREAQDVAFDLFVIDLRLGGPRSGIDLLHALRATHPHTPALAVTACLVSLERPALLAAGFEGCLGKPFLPDELRAAVRHALHLARLRTVVPTPSV